MLKWILFARAERQLKRLNSCKNSSRKKGCSGNEKKRKGGVMNELRILGVQRANRRLYLLGSGGSPTIAVSVRLYLTPWQPITNKSELCRRVPFDALRWRGQTRLIRRRKCFSEINCAQPVSFPILLPTSSTPRLPFNRTDLFRIIYPFAKRGRLRLGINVVLCEGTTGEFFVLNVFTDYSTRNANSSSRNS